MSEEAKKLGALGGKARAAKSSKTELSEQGKRAAQARWNKRLTKDPLPVAEYPGILELGGARIYCAVLNDAARTRVLTQADFLEALGRHRKANTRNVDGEEQTPPVLQGEALKPFISNELRKKSSPIKFRTLQGGLASGYRAEILPDVCELYLRAFAANALHPRQYHIADQARVLLHGLATAGILAMVDQATGFHDARAREQISEILRKFVSKELRPWVRRFPFRFYQRIFELKGWDASELTPNSPKPREVGRITDDLIYQRLAPAVRDELRKMVDRDEKGRLVTKLHRGLTDDVGVPKLEKQIAVTMAVLEISQSMPEVIANMDRVSPRFGKNYGLALPDTRVPAARQLTAGGDG